MRTDMTDPALFFKFHVFVCTNRRPDGHARGSCAAKGSDRLGDYMKVRAKELGLAKTRINTSGCLDRCELGPCVVIYPEGVWYRVGSTADIDRVLVDHIANGSQVEELRIAAPS